MFGATRVGIDTAGGLIASSPQAFVRIGGFLAAVVGSTVATHGTGSHIAATLPNGSVFVKINGVALVIANKAATCGHLATGGTLVNVSA